MGDRTIALQARQGLREAIASVGETVRLRRYAQERIPGRATGRRARLLVDQGSGMLPKVDAIVAEFDRALIDGEAIRVGDRELTMVALDGPTDENNPFYFLPAGNSNKWPPLRIGDGVDVGGSTLTVTSTNTTRVSGLDVSVTAVLR